MYWFLKNFYLSVLKNKVNIILCKKYLTLANVIIIMLATFFYIIKNEINRNRLKHLVSILFIFISIFHYSQKASIFENISESNGLPSNFIFNASEDQNHIIWIGTDKGLATYRDGKWISFDVDNGLPGNYINKAIADKKNGLLIYISEKGLYFFNTNTNILAKRYSEVDENRIIDMQNADIDDNYIILYTISISTKKERFYAFDRNNINKLSELKISNKNTDKLFRLNNGKVIANFKIFEKKPKVFSYDYAFLESSYGVIRYQNGKIKDTLSEKNGLANNYVSNILKRKNGDIFFTTLGSGISILRRNNSKKSFNNININVRDIIYHNNKKYILADGYLYVLGNDSIEQKYFLRKDALSFYISGNEMLLGSFKGLYFYRLTPKPILKKFIPITSGISKIFKTNSKIVLSTYGNGIVILENTQQKRINNKHFNNIENLIKLKKGYALLSYEHGISILNDDFQFITHFDKNKGLESNYVTSAFSDNDTLYIGTKNGASVFFNNKLIFKYKKENGFKGNMTKAIFRDHKKQIWILTDQFLFKKSGYTLKPFGSLRLIDEVNDKIIKGTYSSENNAITVATKNKFSEIEIDKIVPSTNTYPIILDKILSGGKVVDSKSKIIFEDYGQDMYFIFQSVDKEILTQSQLYYKIDNEDWKPFTQPRVLKFSHLERKNYTLSIKEINADGYDGYLKKSIKFKVIGPFYTRWWFILITIIILSYFIYNYANEINKKKYVKQLNILRIKNQIENERKRISRDLHDNIGAYVTSLISKIDLLKQTPDKNDAEIGYDSVRLDAEHILALLRQTIYVLANKDTTLIALYDNFKTYAQKFLQTNNIRIIFEENIENNRKMDPTTSSSIFRIMQEALQNIHKHADATKVEINVISKDKIIIYLKDNGKGFKQDELKFGYGLKNMKERAIEIGFKFNIYSDFTGTTIELSEI